MCWYTFVYNSFFNANKKSEDEDQLLINAQWRITVDSLLVLNSYYQEPFLNEQF